jgi:hypothetical protein
MARARAKSTNRMMAGKKAATTRKRNTASGKTRRKK